jgi:hypothetical protein
MYGTEFLAVEPDVQAGVLNVAGGSGIESNRLSTIFRASVGTSLASRMPSLLNGPGITSLDGVSVPGPRFDENMPLRDGVPLVVGLADGTERVIQAPVINTVPGAMQIQEVLEHIEWVSQSGNPVAYAPHLRRSPLDGIAAKSVIYQFARGDQIVPNPTTTAILRAGALADRATFYRHDLAFAENPQLPTIPHGFLTRLDIPGFRAITLGAQQQIATFFATGGTTVIHPEPSRFFEVPISLPLPEDLNYILPPTGPRGAAVPMLGVAGTPAAASQSGATFADMGSSTEREDWAAVEALLTASPGQSPLPLPLPLSPRERGEGMDLDDPKFAERCLLGDGKSAIAATGKDVAVVKLRGVDAGADGEIGQDLAVFRAHDHQLWELKAR